MLSSGWIAQRSGAESGQDLAQQNPQPADEAAEVVAGGGQDDVVGIAAPEPEIVAAHAMLGLEMADDRLDGGPAAEFILRIGGHVSKVPLTDIEERRPPLAKPLGAQ